MFLNKKRNRGIVLILLRGLQKVLEAIEVYVFLYQGNPRKTIL